MESTNQTRENQQKIITMDVNACFDRGFHGQKAIENDSATPLDFFPETTGYNILSGTIGAPTYFKAI